MALVFSEVVQCNFRSTFTMKFKAFTLSICALIACFSITSSAKELYVSPSGDDSVSYSENSNSSPWKTIAKGVYSIRAGDTLHIRGGNYAPFKAMRVRSDYDNQTYDGIINLSMDAESGTKDQPVLITAYENETVIIDLINAETFIHLDNKSYWSFEDLTFINGGKVFVVGQNNAAEHNSFRNLNITGALGGDNFGAIKLVNGNSEHTTIENNVIKGPGHSDQIHQNTSAIYLKSLNNVHIKNNVLSNAPIGIYYKHRTTESLAEDIDIQIDGNFIYNTPRSSMELNSNYATISNNIIGKNTGDIRLSNANGSPGGDYNVIDHNTFSGGSLNLSGKTQLGDPIPGAIGNKVFNNIFSITTDVAKTDKTRNVVDTGIFILVNIIRTNGAIA